MLRVFMLLMAAASPGLPPPPPPVQKTEQIAEDGEVEDED